MASRTIYNGRDPRELPLHQDHVPQNAADVEWMPEVARRGWVIISPDIRISRDRLMVEAIMTSGAAVFCLAGGHLTGEQKARSFLRCLPGSRPCWSGRPARSSPGSTSPIETIPPTRRLVAWRSS